MNTTSKPTVSPEEAVARIVNLSYVPTGFTIVEMTAAYMEIAEIEYENARADHLPSSQTSLLKIRLEACRARHSLTEFLLEALVQELGKSEDSMVVRSGDSDISPRLTLDSVSNWAFDQFGIHISDGSPHGVAGVNGKAKSSTEALWQTVTIKIYADYRIGFKVGDGKFINSNFEKIGLRGTKKAGPNQQGVILIALSKNIKYPDGMLANKHKTSISKLRCSLTKLTGIESDPFFPFNVGDGWLPRFDLIDDRRNADERAKEKATHVSFNEAQDSDETPDFDDDNDAAGLFLRNSR